MKILTSTVSIVLAFVICLCVFTSCSKTPDVKKPNGSEPISENTKTPEKAQFKTVPVLEDTRPTETKQNTFTTLNGNQVTYNMNTRKIVAISGAGDLAAFGLRPSAVIADSTTVESYKTFFEGVKLLNYTQPFDAEEVLSYEPELILVNQLMSQSDIEELEKIAPVIPLYRESFDFEERLSYIGKIFGLEENARVLIKYAEETKQAALDKVADMNLSEKTVTVFYYLDGVSVPPTEYWYFNKIIYDYLGMKRLEIVDRFLETQDNPFAPISYEVLTEYEGDVVIYADIMAAMMGTELSIPNDLAENPMWKMLKAVNQNKVGIIDAMLYAEKDVLYLYAQYDGILKAFEKAQVVESK
ncbi:MAG: ABC transporter substrate-binding protein [Clostridiales bacterium]|nr:ABC transporter substrate-binding protein [Clostridiales bacterium]